MFARTPRLLLRPGWIEDAPALAAVLDEDERAARKPARAGRPHGNGIEDARRFLARPPGPLPEFLIFVREPDGPRLIGGIGLSPDASGEAELGYWIAASDRNRGYATEAGRAVVEIAHLGLKRRRIVATHRPDNPASGRVLHKLGFRPAGRRARAPAMRGEAAPSLRLVCEAADETQPPAMRPLAA